MSPLLDASTSTAATTGVYLEVGAWVISAEIVAADGASLIIEKQDNASTIWRPVTKVGLEVPLSEAETDCLEISSGDNYRVTRSGGVAAVTVRAKRIRT